VRDRATHRLKLNCAFHCRGRGGSSRVDKAFVANAEAACVRDMHANPYAPAVLRGRSPVIFFTSRGSGLARACVPEAIHLAAHVFHRQRLQQQAVYTRCRRLADASSGSSRLSATSRILVSARRDRMSARTSSPRSSRHRVPTAAGRASTRRSCRMRFQGRQVMRFVFIVQHELQRHARDVVVGHHEQAFVSTAFALSTPICILFSR